MSRPVGREARNMLAIAAYQIAVRIGWIFKTETIIMPAVLDAVAEAGVLRGLLPVLARFGQSLPPLAFAGRLAAMPVKKRALFVTTLSMAACFGLLAWAWDSLAATHPGILAGIFLAAYAAFAVSNGLNQLVVAALQGKLIDVPHRGRLMVLSTAVGSVLAILAAVLLLQGWLDAGPAGFTRVFAATAIFFLIAAAVPVFIDEPSTPLDENVRPWGRVPLQAAGRELLRWRGMLARDPALAKLCLVAAFFSVALFLFPHYQAFARDQLRTGLPSLLVWLVAQNVTTGLASLVAGPATDRRGTRIVLIGLLACTGITPLLVVGLSLLPREIAGSLFWLVYVPLGINPLLMRTFSNAALEFAPSLAEQPRAVSLVGVSLAAPFVVSPLVGWLIDVVGFRPVFLCGAGVIAVGVWLATGLPEPRQRGRAGPA